MANTFCWFGWTFSFFAGFLMGLPAMRVLCSIGALFLTISFWSLTSTIETCGLKAQNGWSITTSAGRPVSLKSYFGALANLRKITALATPMVALSTTHVGSSVSPFEQCGASLGTAWNFATKFGSAGGLPL